MTKIRPAVRAAALTVAAVLLFAPLARADFEAGQRAWEAGDAGGAVAHWQVAAEAGDARAMLALGRLYKAGIGVLQDYIEAHKWLNLAAARGDLDAAKERNELAAEMTADERAEGQRLARTWRPVAEREENATAAPASPSPADEAAAGPPLERALREAQSLLAALGYDPGPPDGIWGPRSVRAYQSFLRDAGLPSAETLTPGTLRAMRSAADAAPAETPAVAAAVDAAPPSTLLPPEFLHLAAKSGDVDGLQAALVAGAEVDALDSEGWTALMHAVSQEYPFLVEPLLAAGADPNVRAPDGATALFMSAAAGNPEIVVLLMKADADVSVGGPQGQTPVEVARLEFGEAEAARRAGEDPALVALLEGKSWAGEREAIEELGPLAWRWPTGMLFQDCAECPEMVVIPEGPFMMGSPTGEEGRNSSEGPVHRVVLAEPFAVRTVRSLFRGMGSLPSGWRVHSRSGQQAMGSREAAGDQCQLG